MPRSLARVTVGRGFTVRILYHGRLLLGTIKRLPWKGFVSIEFGGVSVARQGARILLVARVRDAGGSVVEELLDVVCRVLEAGRRGARRTVHESVASAAHALWKSAVVVSWFQGLAAFVLGEERIYKVGTHGSLA